MKIPSCRTCRWAVPTGKGKSGGVEVDVGDCHGDTPKVTGEGAGVFPPVTLDAPGCRHHETLTAASAAKSRRKP